MQNQIDVAVEQYRKLLNEQLSRVARMESGEKAKDFTAMDKIVVGVCGGDGIGPIIVNEAKRVLDVLLEDEIKSGKIEIREIDGLTIENRLAQNVAVPLDTP